MTKAVLCIACSDIVSPLRAWQTDRSWRWCQCDHTAVRWRDGTRGLLEVTSLHGASGLRVIGFDNAFLVEAVAFGRGGRTSAADWRDLHARTCRDVPPGYLFHADNRDCWALVVAVGESGDVTFIEYPEARSPVPVSPGGESTP